MDLTSMSWTELRKLETEVAAQLKNAEKREREKAIETIYSIAHSVGLPLKTLLGAKSPSTKTAQYRDPANPAHTWNGRGPRPKWFRAAIERGMQPDSLRI